MKKLVRVIENKTYTGKNGKEYNYNSYYIEDEKGYRVAIIPNTAYNENARHDLQLLADETIDLRKPQ